jgi:hypothetical protein
MDFFLQYSTETRCGLSLLGVVVLFRSYGLFVDLVLPFSFVCWGILIHTFFNRGTSCILLKINVLLTLTVAYSTMLNYYETIFSI